MVPQLPQWKCHKVVRAAKIGMIHPPVPGCAEFEKGKLELITPIAREGLTDKLQALEVDVTPEWLEHFKPEAGGYYVVYEDGYASFSPAKAFEEGYTLLEQAPA